MSTWYWKTDQFGEPNGPVSAQEIKQLVLADQLHRDSFLRKEGMEKWIPAGRLKELFDSPGSQKSAQHAGADASRRSGGQQGSHAQRVHHSTGMYQKNKQQESNQFSGSFGSAASMGWQGTRNDFFKGGDYESLPTFFSFRGRARRTTYFLQTLGISVALTIVMLVVVLMSGDTEEISVGASILIILLSIAGAIVQSFPHVKRLHDLNLSAWFYWISIIPLVNFFFGLYMLFGRGTEGPNKYGPDPRD